MSAHGHATGAVSIAKRALGAGALDDGALGTWTLDGRTLGNSAFTAWALGAGTLLRHSGRHRASEHGHGPRTGGVVPSACSSGGRIEDPPAMPSTAASTATTKTGRMTLEIRRVFDIRQTLSHS